MHRLSFPGLGIELNLPTEVFSVGPVSVKWYAVMLVSGLILAIVFAYRNSKKFGIDMELMYEPIFYATIAGIVGARAYYCIFNFDQYKDNPLSILYIWEGGLAIYGAIIGVAVVGVLILKARKIPILPVFDMVAMGFLIGQGVGRWGNFFNIEAFGSNTTLPWGMTGPTIIKYLSMNSASLLQQGMDINPLQPVHPTFLYESLWCILGFVLLRIFMKHRRYDGQILLMYITWYGFERMIIEGLRTDSLFIGSLRVSQVLSGIIFVFGAAMLIYMYIRIKKHNSEDYLPLFVNTDGATELFARADAIRASEKSKKNKKPEAEETGAAEETENGTDKR